MNLRRNGNRGPRKRIIRVCREERRSHGSRQQHGNEQGRKGRRKKRNRSRGAETNLLTTHRDIETYLLYTFKFTVIQRFLEQTFTNKKLV